MEVQGKIIAALEQRTGESKRNPGEKWVSQDFVVEVPGQFVRRMVFTVFGSDRLQRFNIQVGMSATVSFDIDAHEWNGRWFNDIRAYDVRQIDPNTLGGTGVAPFSPETAPFPPMVDPAAPAAPGAPAAPVAPFEGQSDTADDLPF